MKQADGLLAELNVSFCYDFVEQCCDFVYKSLSVMQRLRYEMECLRCYYCTVLDCLASNLIYSWNEDVV